MPIDATEKSNKLLIKHAGKHCYPWIPAIKSHQKFTNAVLSLLMSCKYNILYFYLTGIF